MIIRTRRGQLSFTARSQKWGSAAIINQLLNNDLISWWRQMNNFLRETNKWLITSNLVISVWISLIS